MAKKSNGPILTVELAGEDVTKALLGAETKFFPSLVAVGGLKPHPKGSREDFPPNSITSGFLVRYRDRHYLMTCGHSTYDNMTGDYDTEWTIYLATPGQRTFEAGVQDESISMGRQRFMCTRSWITEGHLSADTVDVGLIELPNPEQLVKLDRVFFELSDPPDTNEPLWNENTLFCVLGFPSAHFYNFAAPITKGPAKGKLVPGVRLLDSLVGGDRLAVQGALFSFELQYADADPNHATLTSLFSGPGVQGMSGGPCFAIVPNDGDSGSWDYRLCGIQIGAVPTDGKRRTRLICQNLAVWLREFGLKQ